MAAGEKEDFQPQAINSPQFERLRAILARLGNAPPPVLLLEGGSEKQRLDFALYWAMTLNCPSAVAQSPAIPCMECPVCRQIAANENIDLLIFDGRISNRQDEEKPGPIKALRIENIRQLKASLGVRPHGSGKRVAILQGMSASREEALNSLLKTLEEPGENTVFALLAPQREQILPTLVSRSICLTLPWIKTRGENPDLAEWTASMASFLATGQGFLDNLAARNAIDATAASHLVNICQQALVGSLTGAVHGCANSLEKIFIPMAENPEAAAHLSQWLAEAQSMLAGTVNPARVLEAFATRLRLLLTTMR